MQEDRAELVLEVHPQHGEGPVWDERRQRLFWVDIAGRAVHVHDPTTGDDVEIRVDQQVGAVALREGGTLLVAAERGLAVLDPGSTRGTAPDDDPIVLDIVVPLESDKAATRCNDGAVDPHGRFWIGTMAHDHRPATGALYRVDADRSVHRQLSGLTISNGMAWSRDGATAWFIDSTSGWVDMLAVDPDTGDVQGRRPAIDLHRGPGVPDGMTIDAEGGRWVAMYGGWQVRRHGPDGALDAVVTLPVAQPTSCVLGGPDLDELFITTSPENMDAETLAEQPLSGSLFRCTVDVPGLPPDRWAG